MLFLAHILRASVATIDALLVPMLAATIFPWLVLRWARQHTTYSFGWILLLVVPTLPFLTSTFTITTPQALANILFLTLLFLVDTPILRYFLIPAIVLVHPLTGIAAILFCGVHWLQRTWKQLAWAANDAIVVLDKSA